MIAAMMAIMLKTCAITVIRRSPDGWVVLSHVKQWKRLSSAIEVGSSLDYESDSAIKRDRPFVLFVDVDGRRSKVNNRMSGQPSPDTGAMERGMNEQRLHLVSRHANKSHEAAVAIADAVKVVEREECVQYQRFEELDVGL